MFTIDHTFYEIMNTEPVGRGIGNLFPLCWLGRIPKGHMHDSMREIAGKDTMEWGEPFLSDAFVECANILMEAFQKQRFQFIPLWKEQKEGWIPDGDLNSEEGVSLFTGNPKVDNIAFAHTFGKESIPPYASDAVPTEKRERESGRPAVIICPGGGYEMLSAYSEGIQLAQRIERDGGYKAFILRYRVAPNAYPLPHLDLTMAVMYVRLHAQEYGIDPERIITLGASAGGHLCASQAYLYDSMKGKLLEMLPAEKENQYRAVQACPNGVGLLYPVISFLEEYHEGSFRALTRDHAFASGHVSAREYAFAGEHDLMEGGEELREKLSVEKHIGSGYPVTYAFANEDDGCVPASNTRRLDQALEKAGIAHLCQTFPSGDHGVGLGYNCSCRRWSENMLDFFEKQV